VRARRPKRKGRGPQSQVIRIIGGRWRGRHLSVPALPGLRPSPDRVRETLFNWLQGLIDGARCLDLYAGSGALGLEAASRGAAQVVLVDRSPEACAGLRQRVRELQGEQGLEVVQMSAEAYLSTASEPFDLVFLDPPYRQDLLAPTCAELQRRGLVKPGSRVYLEAESELGRPVLPSGWRLLRSKQAGAVGYHLALCGDPSA
jgi:16S rRNA (guanine966-N2)-methyltransferase